MANITLSIPEDTHNKMKQFTEIRWSEVARKAIIEKIETLELAESIAQKSQLTKKDVDEFSKRIKKLAHKRFIA